MLGILIVTLGCASPKPPPDNRPIVTGPSQAQSLASSPRFSSGGPDAERYGANEGYPVKAINRLPFFVGVFSHNDQLLDGRTIRRAASPSRLLRAPSEPALRYEYQAETRALDDYLARNPATGLLIARGDTILVERYQYARTDRHRFASFSMAKTVTAMLVGLAIAENLIRSVDEPAGSYVPALADTEYGRTSLRHLLQMSSGVRFRENYSGQERCRAAVRRDGAPGRPRRRGGREAVQRTCPLERRPVLLRIRRDPGAWSGPSKRGRAAGRRVLSGQDLGANRGGSRRHLDYRRLGAGGDLLLSQRGAARLRAARFAARARRSGRRPADHPEGVVVRGYDHRPERLAPQESMGPHRLRLWLSDLDLSRRASHVRPDRRRMARPSTSIRRAVSSWFTRPCARSNRSKRGDGRFVARCRGCVRAPTSMRRQPLARNHFDPRILKGAWPADLPVVQPSKYEPQDRQGPRPDDPAVGVAASGTGHRVNR